MKLGLVREPGTSAERTPEESESILRGALRRRRPPPTRRAVPSSTADPRVAPSTAMTTENAPARKGISLVATDTILLSPTAAPQGVAKATMDARLIEILDAPLAPGESADAGFRRKEASLGETLASLGVAESRDLHGRLSVRRPGDVLAERFARLNPERRQRLLHFLADVRRRQAIANARR